MCGLSMVCKRSVGVCEKYRARCCLEPTTGFFYKTVILQLPKESSERTILSSRSRRIVCVFLCFVLDF